MKRLVLLRVLLGLFCTTCCAFGFAQDRTITGIISDQNGAALSGATVTAKEKKSITTATDVNGAFKLSVPANVRTLVISFVGMKPQEVSIVGRTTVITTLDVAENNLNEVVVIGYGKSKRADVTSSISSISEKDIKNLPVSGVDQALQGKVAGVTVNSNGGQPGGGINVQIRGVTSVNSNEPLYVIDGVPILTNSNSFNFSSSTTGGGGAGQSSNSALATLNPNDIQSIDILKDASAQAIYGSLAANGVVLITTKKGKSGEGKINYDMYVGWQRVPKKLDMMNLREFAEYQNGIAAETNQTPTPEFIKPDVLGEGTDWQDAIFQTGKIQNHQLSFSGGQNKTTYYFSANYFDQTGILLNSEFRRYALRASVDQQVKSWIKAGINVNASRSDQRLTLADEQDGTITQALLLSPVISIRNLDGSYGGQSTFGGLTYYTASNPVAQSANRLNTRRQSKIFGNVYGDITIAPFLNFHTELGFDYQMSTNRVAQLTYAAGTVSYRSGLVQETNNSLFWVFKNYFNFNKNYGKHSIYATAGHENWLSRYEYQTAAVIDLKSNDQVTLANGTPVPESIRGAPFESAMESWFARAGYTFNNKYSVNLSYRADASSNFGPNNRWGYFPAASVGWTVTNEGFASNIKQLNYMKLRLGVGAVGNQNLPNGAPQPPYTAGIIINTNGFGSGNFIKNLPNPDLKWESVVTYNGGIDLSLFNRKLDVSVDVYKKETKDMLLFSSVPDFFGLGQVQPQIVNDGAMTNRGIDISITSYNINKKDLTWRTSFVFSHYKNTLDRLIGEDAAREGKIFFDRVTVTRSVAGQPIGSFYGAMTNGLFSQSDADRGDIPVQFNVPVAGSATEPGTYAGDVRFVNLAGSRAINDSDLTFIGSPHPKFTYGLTNTFTFKGFDLSIFIQGSHGAKIYNYLRRQLEGIENLYANQLKTVNNRYTPTNTNTNIPRWTSTNVNNAGGTIAIDRFLESGSYLRIQNIQIGYNLPARWIRNLKLNNVRAYVSAQNLYTFTDYSGYDPEIGAFNKSVDRMNIDNGHYPNPRTLTVGVNVEF